jgi:hypothetical protein
VIEASSALGFFAEFFWANAERNVRRTAATRTGGRTSKLLTRGRTAF